MSRIQDRKKQRREYLRKKGTAYTIAFLAVLGALLCALLAFSGRRLFFGGAFGLLLIARGMLDSARRARRRAIQIPYIPPVTADTLPAEEVLVRGAEEPTGQQSEVLLRGAQGSGETPAEELLRGSDASVKGQRQALRGTYQSEEDAAQELLRGSQGQDRH